MSRVGLKPISLPDKVKVGVADGTVHVEGPKGELDFLLPKGIGLREEEGAIVVSRESETIKSRSLHGTVRSIVQNMIRGVTEGFVKELEIQGVGMRAAVKGQSLDLALGKSHPILHPIPNDLTVSVAENTKIKVEGIDKQLVGQFASDVRSYYPPEPYKGKGVRYADERVRRKAGKSVGS